MKTTHQEQWNTFLVAIMSYTRLPVPKDLSNSDALLDKSRMHRSRTYLPLIGIIIGLIATLSFLLASAVLPLNIAVMLSMITTILATGAFHEDGLADSCDGLGGGWNKQQILSIMKDSRLGTYGVIGLILILGLKFATLLELANHNKIIFCTLLVFAHCISRSLCSTVIERYDYVQDSKFSKIKSLINQPLSAQDKKISIGITLASLALLLCVAPTLIWTPLPALGITVIFIRYCQRKIGGYTGDILGAVQQISEITIYLSALVLMRLY